MSLESTQHIHLKDLTWSDNDNNLYRGTVVAALQVLDLFPPHDHPLRKNEEAGLSLCNQVFQSPKDPATSDTHTNIGYLVSLLSHIINTLK